MTTELIVEKKPRYFQKLNAYARLMRLDKPVGILLLMWPMLMALWGASRGIPDLKILVIFLTGCVLMRSAGCVINDFADKDFDGHVERTQNRPMAVGLVSPREAVVLFMGLSLLAFLLILNTNRLTLQFSGVALGFVFACPFLKRYTYLPQFFLGATFAWSIPMAFACILNRIPNEVWWLYAATLLWAVAYDTAYALADKRDDLKIGIKSTAILFGPHANLMILLSQAASCFLICIYAYQAQLLGWGIGLSVTASMLYALYLQTQLKGHHPKKCFKAFIAHHRMGALWFLGFFVDTLML